jgi:CRISPR type III-B/RAMP module RAMP protein Cmr1
MNKETFQFEIITPCFCGGAEPNKQAEIRAPSIRGQLRWWFRTLGGFQSLANRGMNVREQEQLIFGSTAGGGGRAGRLIVRVSGLRPSADLVDDVAMNAKPGSERGFLLFPLRAEKVGTPQERRRDRGVFNKSAVAGTTFSLHLLWRGEAAAWEDIRALVSVFGHLGALGFRSRRAMGALAFRSVAPPVAIVLERFRTPGVVMVRQLTAQGPSDAISVLARWLRSWRSHGRTGNNAGERAMPGYAYAKRDHDMAASGAPGAAFRPALGLPILSKYGEWNETFDEGKARRNPRYKGEGRFASPVLLRPHRDAQGKWHALVVFVDAHQWPAAKRVYLNGHERNVSLDLYEAMKNDERLKDFLA